MTPAQVDLVPHLRGDTWIGILRIGPVVNTQGTPAFAQPVASARLHFRRYDAAELGYALSSDGSSAGNIVIEDAAAWQFAVPPQALPLDAGTWAWDFETTDTAGTVRTLYAGKLVVRPDITHAG